MSVFCPNIKSPVWIKHTELVGNDLNYLSWIGNKGYPMELNSKGKPSNLYADLVKEYKDEKLAARIKALTFSKSIMEKLGDVKKDSKGEYKLEDVKKILTLSKEPISQIKLGVSELFESNPELANAVYEALGFDINTLSYGERAKKYKEFGITKSDGTEITERDIEQNPTFYQNNTNQSTEKYIASEKTIRDLAARMSDRIGIPVIYISDRSQQFKGKLEKGTAVINLAYATLDTPIHEILGHPIIRAIKNRKNNSEELEYSELYENLLEELSINPKGKEVLDRIKRDYQYKTEKYKTGKVQLDDLDFDGDGTPQPNYSHEEKERLSDIKYSLEEQQEEAIVELLGLMTAEKLDAVKDGKLISLLKRLLKEIKAFVRDLLKQREVEIDKLPDNMTLGDLSDLLAYSNSKLILPGNEVIYTTPDNQQFKTYAEASKHISDLIKQVSDIDLDSIIKEFPKKLQRLKEVEAQIKDEGIMQNSPLYNKLMLEVAPTKLLLDFIEKNKGYEQSKEIIENWKKVNNIQYNPEEIYSRGQEFSSVVGAYSSFDVNLMMQNLLQHIEDNQKAGGEFIISAFTKPVNKQIDHLEQGGGKIKFKIYPQSQDIKWVANTDVYSGSVWDASEKVNKDKKSELLGVSYTKYPALQNIGSVQPNLAAIVDNLAHHHNELGIVLTGNNFRLEYDEDIPYSTKKVIDSINSILDQKYGKLVKPDINKINTIPDTFEYWQQDMNEDGGVDRFRIKVYKKNNKWFEEFFDTSGQSESVIEITYNEVENKFNEALASNSTLTRNRGIQPTQTNETLKESIESVKNRVNDGTFGIKSLTARLKFEQNKIKILQANIDTGNKVEESKIELEKVKAEINRLEELIKNPPQKEYTEQALINTKIAALKEAVKKYPRSLIRSEVRSYKSTNQKQDLFDPAELPFQLIGNNNLTPKQQLEEKLKKQQAQQLYSSYLNTIFPDSKVKDIVYHGTNAQFDKFDKSFIKRDGVNSFGDKFYFLPKEMLHMLFKGQRVIPVLLNMKSYTDYFEQGTYETNDNIRRFEEGILEELAVNEPEQIHILGSKQDMEGFKEFVEGKNKLLQENGSLATISQSKIDNLQSIVEYQLLNEKDEDLEKKVGQSYMFLSEKDAQRFTYLVERNKEFPKEFKVTKKITKYERDSKNPLKFNGYNKYVDLYYIKSNKNKKSNLYDIVNKETGEVIASKVRILSVSKDVKSEIANKYGLEHTPTKVFSANRSIAFALYKQKPSKAKYIAQSKKYLYDAIKFLNPEETNLKINLDKIEELLSNFPEEMWDYINTTYSPENSTNINASISLQNQIKFELPKLGFLQEIEKITGIPLQGISFKNYDSSGSLAKVFKYSKLNGEWGNTITIDNSMTTKELKASIRYYLSTKKIFKQTSEEENVRKYAEHRELDYNKLRELVFGDTDKALTNIAYNQTGNSDTIELSKWRQSIRNYDWQFVELFSKPYENFQNTVKERIIAKFKDKNLFNNISHLEYFFNTNAFNWLNINFNNISGQYYMADMETEANVGVETKMGGIINPFEMKIYQKPKAGENFLQEKEVFNRLAAVLHEPFHALHALSYGTKEELELREAFDNLYRTDFGKEMMNQVFGSGYNQGKQVSYDTLYKEFTAFTAQLMLYPKQWIKNTDLRSNDIYAFIEKIQTLQDKTYEEIVKTQQKIGTTETTITEEEKIKLTFLEKLYNYLIKALNKIIPLSKKFITLIVDSKLVEKKIIEDTFGEVEETVTKTLKLPENVKKSKEQFLDAMEELQSAINTLMQIDSKLFSSENITNFFTSNRFNQEKGSKQDIEGFETFTNQETKSDSDIINSLIDKYKIKKEIPLKNTEQEKNISLQEELNTLKEILPDIPVQVIDKLLLNGRAEGMFAKGLITLSTLGKKGVAYHEAFHAVTQVYLTEEQRNELYQEYRDINGKGISTLDIEEDLAEEFREYMLSKGTYKPYTSKTISWLFDQLDKLLNFLRSNKSRLFNDIRKGRYANSSKYDTSAILYSVIGERINAPADMVNDIVENMAFQFFNRTQLISFNNEFDLKNPEHQARLYNVINEIRKDYADRVSKATPEVKVNYMKIAKEWKNIVGALKLKLLEYIIDLRIEDSNEGNEEETKERLNIKSSLESSMKDSLPNDVKIMISMLQSKKSSNYFGDNFEVLAPFNESWKLLEDNLTGIVGGEIIDGKQVSMVEAMLNKLKTLSNEYEPFKELYSHLTSSKVPTYKKIQFFSTFSKSNILYEGTLYEKDDRGNTIVKQIDADTQSKGRQVFNQWVENFNTDNENRESVLNFNNLKTQVEKFNNLYTEAKGNKTDKIPTDGLLNLRNTLNEIGIPISKEGLYSYMTTLKGKTQSAKYINLLSDLNYVFNSYRNSNSVEDYIHPKDSKGVIDRTQFALNAEKIKNYLNDNEIIKRLAEYEARYKKIIGDNMVVGPDGKSYWTKSLNNYLTKQMQTWKTNPAVLENMLTKEYYKYSIWGADILNRFKNGDTSFDLKVFLFNRLTDSDDTGKTYTEQETGDEIIERMNGVLAGKVIPNTSSYSMLTFADKPVWYKIKGAKFQSYGLKSKSDISLTSTAVNNFYRYACAEMYRIGTQIANPSKVVDYETNALKSSFFPKLSKGGELAEKLKLYTDKGEVNLSEENKKEIKQYIADSLKDFIKSEISKIYEAELVRKNEKGDRTITGLDSNLIIEYGLNDDKDGKGLYNLLSDYILNQTQANIETTFLFTGDGAYYKDLSKRVIAISASGKDLVVGDNSGLLNSKSNHPVREKYNISVIKDVKKDFSEDSNFKENVKALSEDIYRRKKEKGITKTAARAEALEIMSPYTNINQGDGGAMILPERFREVMVGLGLWTDEIHDYLFDKIEKEGDMSSLHKLIKEYHFPTGQSLKGQHFELVDDGNGRLIPIYLKYAQAVLWAPVVKGTKLEDVKNRMKASKIDELVFESGIKSGAYGIGTIDKFGSNISLSNNNWKLQQDSISKFEKKGVVTKGTQPVKNIMANINPEYVFDFNGEAVKGSEIIAHLHRVESSLSDLGRKSLEKEFGLSEDGRILNREKFTGAIVKQLMKDGVSENIWRPIAENPDVPLDVLFSDKIEYSIYSMIKKATVSMKVNGGAFVQMSNVGFERLAGYKNISELKAASRNELIWLTDENELRGPTIDTKTGIVKPGQVFLPSRVLNLIPGLDEKLRNGEITNAELKYMLGDALNLVGYRIPNQNLTSIDSLEVAGILPSFMGDQIVTFTEITAKTGSDFDIDKMFTLMYNVKWNAESKRLEKVKEENSKESLENERIDLWRAILHSKDMFGQVITPLDAEFLKNNAYFIALLEEINKNFIKDKEGNIEKDSNGHYRSTTVEDMGYKTLSELLADPEIENKAVKYFKNKKQSELEFYLPSNQLEIKARNMVGKAGIGQTANHVTHIPLAQQAKLSYTLTLVEGRGKIVDGKSILYSETNENGDLITQVISAWLNAYVDNAKDPYIALINNNTKTAPTVFMLLRAGVDPRWVNMFVSQPIIKRYVENLNYENRRFKEEDFVTTVTFNVNGAGELFKTTRTNTYMNAITKTLMDLKYNIESLDSNINDEELNTNDKLMKQLLYPDMMSQFMVFKKFLQLQAFANDLNNTVTACKFDTSGAGMDISENLAMEHKKVSASQSRFLDNASVERLFDGTMLETFYKNSSLFAREMLSKEFISSSPKALNTLEHVLTETGNDFSNADLTRKVLKQYKSYVLSGAPILRHSRENIKDMFSPEGMIVSGMKTLKAYFPNNPLISGFTTSSKKGEHTFVVLPSSKYKDALDAKLMWQEWERLMDNLELDAKLVIGKKGPSTAEKIRLNGKSIVRVLNGTQKVILQEAKLKDGEYQLPGGHLVSVSNLATNGAPFNINLSQFDTEEKKIAFAKSQGYKDFEDIMNNGQSVWLKEFIDGKPFYLYKCEKVEDSRPDVKVSDYMKELVNYAFVTSGFNKNLNSFYDLIPYTYMRGDFNKIDDPTNLYGYIQDIITDSNHVDTLQTEEVDSAFMNQFLRHIYKDNDFVPEIKTGAIEVDGTMKDAPLSKKYITIIDGKKNGFKIPAIQLPYHWNKLANTGSILPKSIVKISSSTTKDMDLYEYVGYNKGSFYFSGVSKLGTNESGKYIYEYSRGNEIESEINESVTGLSEELIKRLRDTKEQIFTNDFGKMREVKKSITFDNLQNVEFVVMPESVNGVKMFVMKAKIKVAEKEYVTKDLGAVPGKDYNEARNNGLETIFETGIDLIKTSTENKC